MRRILELADPEWKLRCADGLVSGEGVIHHVRDARVDKRKAKKGELAEADEEGKILETVDEGVSDKRLFAQESEFGRVLAATERKDNTLSAVLRVLWDRDTATTLAKNSHERASGVLLSVLAHITPHELRMRLGSTEIANGFANRFGSQQRADRSRYPGADRSPRRK